MYLYLRMMIRKREAQRKLQAFHEINLDHVMQEVKNEMRDFMCKAMKSFYQLTKVEEARDLMRNAGPFAHVFDVMGVASWDRAGRIMRINQQFCDLLGRTPQEVFQTNLWEMTHPQDKDLTQAALDLLQEFHQPVAILTRYVRPDGTLVWAHLILNLVYSRDTGREMGSAIVLRATTDVGPDACC